MKRTVMVAILIMAWAASSGAAKSKWQKAAKKGDATAQYMLGWAYYDGTDEEKDYALAFEWWKKAAEQWNADAQYRLGECYRNGTGTAQDEKEAIYWYQKAAVQGNAEAQYQLGQCYYDGVGVEKDMAKALEWYVKAAYGGNKVAISMIQQIQETRAARERAEAEARRIAEEKARKAAFAKLLSDAETGNSEALVELAQCYDTGNNVPRDLVKATECYQKAAEQGNAEAQYRLGWRYETGRGVARSIDEAKAWYTKAAEQGNDDARSKLAAMQKAEEERLARIAAATADKEEDFEWKPTPDGKGVVITGLKGKDPSTVAKIVIPDTIGGKNVTEINGITVDDVNRLQGKGAFAECTLLEYVKLPAHIRFVGTQTFGWCYSLSTVEIPDTASDSIVFADDAFHGCDSLKDVPATRIVVRDAKQFRYKLTRDAKGVVITGLNLGGVAKRIKRVGTLDGMYVEEDMDISGYLQKVIVPAAIEDMPVREINGAFAECRYLKRVELPKSLRNIGPDAFKHCDALRTLTKVGEGTFYGCTSLESIDMSGTKVSVIGGRTNQSKQIGAFEGCSSLKALKLSPSISSIEDRAFRGCYALNSITIPSGVKRRRH